MAPTAGADQRLGLGLVLPPCPSPDELWESLDRAERAGLHSVWVTDRTMGPGGIPWLETLSALAAVAARTSSLKIGTSIFVAARRNPVLSAHAMASVNYLSGDRLILGVGLGGLEPRDYALTGTELSNRGRITDEFIPLYRKLWANPQTEVAGEFYNCAEVGFGPLPSKSIPIWIGGSSPAAVDRVARIGDGWLSIFLSPTAFADGWQSLSGVCESYGRNPAEITPATYLFGAIGETTEEAEHVIRPSVEGLFGTPFDHLRDACVWGSPTDWVSRLREYEQAGVRVANTLLFSTQLVRDVGLLAEVTDELRSVGV